MKQTYNGYSYGSIKEAQYALDLDVKKKAKEIKGWDRQVSIDLTAHGKKVCRYIIDFIVYHHDGRKEYIEVKGFETDVWRLKWKIFNAQMAVEDPSAIITLEK